MARNRTKLIRYLLKKIGYDLRRIQKTTFIPEGAETGFGRGGGLDAFESVIPRPVTAMDIVLRTCSRVEVSGLDRKRFLDVPKCEVTVRCLNSLLRAIEYAKAEGVDADLTLTVMDDHSDAACIGRIEDLLGRASFPACLQPLTVTGNGPSMEATLTHGRSIARDLLYFVEDDYLHGETAVLEFIRSYERLASIMDKDIALYPDDHPGFYKQVYPSYIVLGSHRHWRSVKGTTFTFLISKPILERYWDNFLALREVGQRPGFIEEMAIYPVYKEVPCFSPLTGLALHVEFFETLAPFVDWKEWWAAAEPEGVAAEEKGGKDGGKNGG